MRPINQYTLTEESKDKDITKLPDFLSRLNGGLFYISSLNERYFDRLCIAVQLIKRRFQRFGIHAVPIGLLQFLCKIPVQHEVRSIESIIDLLPTDLLSISGAEAEGRVGHADLGQVLPSLLDESIYPRSPLRFHIAEKDREEALALWKKLSRNTVLVPIADPSIAMYAQRYEFLRQILPSSRARTAEMIDITNQVRALGSQLNFTPAEIKDLFESGSEGKRMVAITLLQALPHPDCFGLVFETIGKSRSAFEQYAALLAAERMLPSLNDEQKSQLEDVIHDQRSGGRGKYITPDSDRWAISERILAALKGRSGATAAPEPRGSQHQP